MTLAQMIQTKNELQQELQKQKNNIEKMNAELNMLKTIGNQYYRKLTELESSVFDIGHDQDSVSQVKSSLEEIQKELHTLKGQSLPKQLDDLAQFKQEMKDEFQKEKEQWALQYKELQQQISLALQSNSNISNNTPIPANDRLFDSPSQKTEEPKRTSRKRKSAEEERFLTLTISTNREEDQVVTIASASPQKKKKKTSSLSLPLAIVQVMKQAQKGIHMDCNS